MKYPLCLTIVSKDRLLNPPEDNDSAMLPVAYLIGTENESVTIIEDYTLAYLPKMLQLTDWTAKDGISYTELESNHDEANNIDGNEYESPPKIKEGFIFSCKLTAKHAIGNYAL